MSDWDKEIRSMDYEKFSNWILILALILALIFIIFKGILFIIPVVRQWMGG